MALARTVLGHKPSARRCGVHLQVAPGGVIATPRDGLSSGAECGERDPGAPDSVRRRRVWRKFHLGCLGLTDSHPIALKLFVSASKMLMQFAVEREDRLPFDRVIGPRQGIPTKSNRHYGIECQLFVVSSFQGGDPPFPG